MSVSLKIKKNQGMYILLRTSWFIKIERVKKCVVTKNEASQFNQGIADSLKENSGKPSNDNAVLT